MQTLYYKSFPDENRNTNLICGRCSSDYPIIVNCAGTVVINWAFRTDNPYGRPDYYLLYLKTGTLFLTVGANKYTVCEGTLVLIPPETPYTYHNKNGEAITYYWVHFTGSDAADLIERLSFSRLPLIRPLPHAGAAVDYRMLKLFDIFIKNDNYRDSELANCTEAMLIELAKASEPRRVGHNKLSRSIGYINDHYTSEIKVADLAAMDFMSVSGYTALFRKIMNTSPYRYIIGLRLDAACGMLRDSNLSVARIAELTGFQNAFFFSKLFKKHMNISPLQYRKNANAGHDPKDEIN